MNTALEQIRKNIARKLLKKGIEAELGIAGRPDSGAAKRFYRRAALLGDRHAQVFLAYYYATDVNVPNNRRLAIAWFKRAARAGEELCSLVSTDSCLSTEEQIQRFKTLIST